MLDSVSGCRSRDRRVTTGADDHVLNPPPQKRPWRTWRFKRDENSHDTGEMGTFGAEWRRHRLQVAESENAYDTTWHANGCNCGMLSFLHHVVLSTPD